MFQGLLFSLALFFSLSGPAMGDYSDFGRSSLAPGATGSLPKYLYSYTDDATAALVEKSQLGLPGRTTYLTPQGGLSPLQAQIELALPQKNTATSLFRISTEGLDPSKVILQRRVTGNVFNRGGGGTEILFDGPIPLENVTRLK